MSPGASSSDPQKGAPQTPPIKAARCAGFSRFQVAKVAYGTGATIFADWPTSIPPHHAGQLIDTPDVLTIPLLKRSPVQALGLVPPIGKYYNLRMTEVFLKPRPADNRLGIRIGWSTPPCRSGEGLVLSA